MRSRKDRSHSSRLSIDWLFRCLSIGLIVNCVMVAPAKLACAATITVHSEDNLNIISITGPIIPGDAEKFQNQIAFRSNSPTVVALQSPGGSVVEGLTIGTTIRLKGYDTAVTNDTYCVSVCGLIWLAGRTRFVGSSAKIGFHAAYTGSGETARESGAANALIGSYLNKIGLSDQAIFFVTVKPPDDLNFLHPTEARAAGIEVSVLADPAPVAPAFATPRMPEATPAAPPIEVSGTGLEQHMAALVRSYFAMWSQGGTNVDGFTSYYPDIINFYGSNMARAKLIEEKRKFAIRWPARQFTVQSIESKCSDNCVVSGVVVWDTKSAERNDHSIGSAKFILTIAPSPAGSQMDGVIISENGSVLTGHKEPLNASQSVPMAMSGPTAGQAASLSSPPAAYASGREDRINYESWFSALGGTPYRDGAFFGAETRGDKPQPSCLKIDSPDWQRGCMDARGRLSVSDLRRKTEPDYRSGWNSL